MRRAALVLLLALAGCDEPTVITHVDKLPHMRQGDLHLMQDGQGIPVEMHGQPWEGAERAALAAAMRPPGGASQSTRFYALPPGGHMDRHGWRLVLHFNPQGGIPRPDYDCKRANAATTDRPPAEGYSVTATFCEGEKWQAHGYLRALKTQAGDREAFSDAIAQLMLAIFRENSDPDR